MSAVPVDTLAAALWLADRGMYVFDVDHPSLDKCAGVRTAMHDPDTCTDRGKHPCPRKGWSNEATTDPKILTAMFTGATRNIGIHCGRSGLVVVDEDILVDFVRFAESKNETIPVTFVVDTGKGRHYYFRVPDGVTLSNDEGELRAYGVNVRAGNGYVVAPGSVHANGTVYRPVDAEAPIAIAPDWLIAALTGHKAGQSGETFVGPTEAKDHAWWRDAEVIHHPDRHNALVAAAGVCRKVGLSRNNAIPTIRDVWARCCKGACDSHEAAKPYTWPEALARLDDIYSRYEAGKPREPVGGEPTSRQVRLTPAASITPRPVRWLWDTARANAAPRDRQGRFPIGSLVLAVGRAGLGKSQFAVWLVAMITTGQLPGALFGKPRAVVYAASEDSWQMTIVPRLIAAGADLDLVFRVDVTSDDDMNARLTLPKDTSLLERSLEEHSVALIVCDPLLSLIDGGINDYRAREVREALEPLVAASDRTRATILGIAHFTKSSGSDPLLLVSGSAAFGQLIRAGVGFARDEDAENPTYVMSTIKNNLGREDLPSLNYRIAPKPVDTPEGETWVSRLEFTGEESPRSVRDLLSAGNGQVEERTERDDAKDFLRDLLASEPVPAKTVQAAAKDAALSWHTVRRAAEDLGVRKVKQGQPGESRQRWVWTLIPEDAHVPTCGHLRGSVGTFGNDADLDAAVQAVSDAGLLADSALCEHGIPRTSCAPCWWGGGAR